MAIAADGDVRLRPVFADAADEAAEMATHLLARGRLAGAQDDRDRPAGRRVVDVDRQKAALIVMRIEERKLLVAVDDIEGALSRQRE